MALRITFGLGRFGAALLTVAFLGVAASAGPPRALAQQQGILIAGASNTSPLQLGRGCDQVVAETPSGIKTVALVALVSPPDAVVSIWRYSNATKLFQVGYFADPNAPTDFTVLGGASAGRTTEAYMICVSKAALILAT